MTDVVGRGSRWPRGLGPALFGIAWLSFVVLGLEQPVAAAREHGSLAAVGLLGAIVGNATAVGGGIVFVPYTMLVLGAEPLTALKMSLGAQAFGMTSGALAWRRRVVLGTGHRVLDGAVVTAAVAGSLFGALVLRPGPLQVKGVFGPVSIGIGLVMLWLAARARADRQPPRRPAGRIGRLRWAVLLAASVVGGLVSSWVAVGVGEVVAVALILALGMPVERAIGFGVVLLAICSIVLAILHAIWLGGVPAAPIAFLVLGVVIGGQIGPAVARRLGARRLKLAFAWVAILDGILFLLQAWNV